MKKTVCLLAISLSFTPVAGTMTKAEATDSPPTTTSVPAPQPVSPDVGPKVAAMQTMEMNPELRQQLRSHKGGSIAFWEAVSWCETNHKWNDGGYYSGGLGMAQSVWDNYGGKEFAPRPSGATKEEQIVVANRMAFFGFQTKHTYATLQDKMNNKPYFRPAVGWRSASHWGKNCVNWKTRKPYSLKYTEAKVSSTGTVSAQSVSTGSTSVKSCPKYEHLFRKYRLPVKKFSYIAWRESRCSPTSVSKRNPNGSHDYGLVQINSSWKTVTAKVCHSVYGDMTVLLDVHCNLMVAQFLLEHTPSGLGNWSTHSGNG